MLHCQVSDEGRPQAPGAAQPRDAWETEKEHGHGLWVVSQVADWFSIDRNGAATTATAAFTLGSGRA